MQNVNSTMLTTIHIFSFKGKLSFQIQSLCVLVAGWKHKPWTISLNGRGCIIVWEVVFTKNGSSLHTDKCWYDIIVLNKTWETIYSKIVLLVWGRGKVHRGRLTLGTCITVKEASLLLIPPMKMILLHIWISPFLKITNT